MPELMPIQLRPLAVSDVDAVLRIQAQCYGESFVEPHEVFARRLCSPAHCSWAAVWGDEVVAYLAAYWSRPEAITPLNGDFACYEDASVLYLHDMAVSSAATGHGLARRMVDAARPRRASAALSARRWCRCRDRRLTGNVKAMSSAM